MATYKNLLNLTPKELGRMSTPELRKVTAALTKAANQKIRRLESAGVDEMSSAYQSVSARAGGKFSTRGKNRQQLLNTFKGSRAFLEMKTSTVRGTRAVKKAVYDRIGATFDMEDLEEGEIDGVNEKEFWRNYRKVEQRIGQMEKGGSTVLQRNLYRTMSGDTRSDIIAEINASNAELLPSGVDPDDLTDNDQIVNSRGDIVEIGDTADDVIELMVERMRLYNDESNATPDTIFRGI